MTAGWMAGATFAKNNCIQAGGPEAVSLERHNHESRDTPKSPVGTPLSDFCRNPPLSFSAGVHKNANWLQGEGAKHPAPRRPDDAVRRSRLDSIGSVSDAVFSDIADSRQLSTTVAVCVTASKRASPTGEGTKLTSAPIFQRWAALALMAQLKCDHQPCRRASAH